MWNAAKQLLQWAPFLYLIFALLSNILPFCRRIRIGDKEKDELNRESFRGDTEYGPDRITLLETPTEALEARIAVLRSAQNTIDMTYYKVVSGSSVNAVLGELLLAADRGVQVRLLLDGRVGLSDRRVKERLALLHSHPNITYRRYNPVHLFRPWTWQAILHDKFIAVDTTWLLLGGRNLGDRYYAPCGYAGTVTNDRDVLVYKDAPPTHREGSVLHRAAVHMDQLWECAATVSASKKGTAVTARQRADLLAALEQFEQTNPKFYAKTINDYRARMVPTKKITLLSNPVHIRKKKPEIAYQMRRLAMTAEKRLIAQTPYSTANPDLLQAMRLVSSRVPNTVLLTNSLASSPNYPAFSNYYSQRALFARTKVRLYEYQSTDSIHGKSMLVDDCISVVGSFNLDDRSFYIDTESMLVIDSEEFAEILLDAMEAIQKQSLLVDECGREYVPGQGLESAFASRGKRAVMVVSSLFSRLFQFLV